MLDYWSLVTLALIPVVAHETDNLSNKEYFGPVHGYAAEPKYSTNVNRKPT